MQVSAYGVILIVDQNAYAVVGISPSIGQGFVRRVISKAFRDQRGFYEISNVSRV